MRPFACAWLLSLLLVGVAHSADWNQWRGPQRDGVAPDSPPLIDRLPADGLKARWKTAAEQIPDGGGWASPVVAAGRAYVYVDSRQRRRDVELPPAKYPSLSREEQEKLTESEVAEYEKNRLAEEADRRLRQYAYEDTIFCLDAATGRTLWKQSRESGYTQWRQSSTPAVVDGRLLAVGADRQLWCVDAETGQTQWVTPLPYDFESDEPIPSSFAVVDGIAVVLAGRLLGLEVKTGRVLWQGDADGAAGHHSSPVVYSTGGKHFVIANVNRGETICVDPRDGREVWRVESSANRSTPVVVGDRLITSSSSRKNGLRCYAISPTGAEELWTFQGVADPGASPVVVDGYVYAQGDKRLVCVDLETGRRAWQTTLDVANPQYTSLVAADGKIFFVHDGLLGVEANGQEYRPLIEAKIGSSGLLHTVAHFRQLLKMDQLEATADGQQQAENLWRREVSRFGPLECASPAIADGCLYFRVRGGLVSYDLSAQSTK